MTLDDVLARDEITHVISLVVTRADEPGQVLLGVRAAVPTSPRHPNVLSSPTMRIPANVMSAALTDLGGADLIPAPGSIVALGASSVERIGCALSLRGIMPFLAEALLARKLGLAEHLVSARVTGTVQAGALALDLVPDAATEVSERTLMLSLVVVITDGAHLVPATTLSYRRLVWVDARRVASAVHDHDALQLLPEPDLEVCLHGLCVRSAAALIGRLSTETVGTGL